MEGAVEEAVAPPAEEAEAASPAEETPEVCSFGSFTNYVSNFNFY